MAANLAAARQRLCGALSGLAADLEAGLSELRRATADSNHASAPQHVPSAEAGANACAPGFSEFESPVAVV